MPDDVHQDRWAPIAQTKLTTLVMIAGDPVDAAAIGTAGLEIAGPIRPRRAADDLREPARGPGGHPAGEPVAALRRQISAAVLWARSSGRWGHPVRPFAARGSGTRWSGRWALHDLDLRSEVQID
jgi:hypothetical protein